MIDLTISAAPVDNLASDPPLDQHVCGSTARKKAERVVQQCFWLPLHGTRTGDNGDVICQINFKDKFNLFMGYVAHREVRRTDRVSGFITGARREGKGTETGREGQRGRLGGRGAVRQFLGTWHSKPRSSSR
jgi:hypothetical protein